MGSTPTTPKVAIVTGGASGIGKATAELFSRSGFAVVVLDINKRGGRALKGVEKSSFRVCDVTDEDQVRRTLKEVHEDYKHVDALLNVAGAALIKPIEETSWEDYRQVVDLNLGGTFLMCKYVVPIMKTQRSGSIVNIASVSAYAGQAFRTMYSASKGGIVSFTKSLAWELAPFNIRVNSISPGLIETPLFRRNIRIESSIRGILPKELRERKRADQAFRRFADPREVAEVAHFLVSENASFVNAVDVPVDCGWLAK